MPEIPRTKFNSPWTVAVIEAALNDVSSAKGSSESLTAALNAMRAEINSLSGGVHLKGAVDYYADLPASPTEGDAYTVRYQGTSGTDPLGIEYAWATYQGTPQWIPIGVDPSVFAKQMEMNAVANAGAKNLLPMTHTNGSITRYGVTCAWDSNSGTMTLNGAHSSGDSAAIFEFYDGSAEDTKFLPAGSYVLTGCPAGGSTSSYRAVLSQIAGAVDAGNGVNFELSEPHYAAYRILISGDVTFNNMVFKPMIRPAAITDSTFVPYAKTNRELTVLTDEDRAALAELVDGGAKNLSRWNSGTSTSAEPTLAQQIPFTSDGGEYTISYNTALTTGTIYIGFKDSNGTATLTVEIGNANKVKTITIPANTAYFNVYAPNFGDYSNFMICSKAAWDVSHAFQPYRPSYQELYEGTLAESYFDYKSSLDSTLIDIQNSAFEIYKYGKMCVARVSLKISGTLTGSDAIFTTPVPTSYRPIMNVYQSVTSRDVGGWVAANLKEAAISIGMDGAVMLRTGTDASSAVYIIGTITWICA